MTKQPFLTPDILQAERQALECLQGGDFYLAEQLCRDALKIGKASSKIWFYLGVCCDVQKRTEEALTAFNNATEINPTETLAWSAKAAIQSKLELYQEALFSALKASKLNPQSSLLQANLGVAYQQLAERGGDAEHYKNALEHYQQSIKINPAERIALLNLSAISLKLRRPDIAREQCIAALNILSDHLDILNNLTEAYIQLFDYDSALSVCRRALLIEPAHIIFNFKHGLILASLKRFGEAADAIRILSGLNISQLNAYIPHLPLESKYLLSELLPELIYLQSGLQQQICCYWQSRDEYIAYLIEFVLKMQKDIPTIAVADVMFQMISLPISSQQRLEIAHKITSLHTVKTIRSADYRQYKRSTHPRLRVGYISPDFKVHVVGFLTNQLYGLHDRSKFEVYAYSLSPNPDDGSDYILNNIASGCDYFYDVSQLDDLQIVRKIQEDEIDILIDLAGYTMNAKPGVIALRPAPVQIAYLGYPGTSGADFIDYAMIDYMVCPVEDESNWSESVVRLPNSYCPFDAQIDNSISSKSRADFALPEHGIIFCCFNTNYKIEPAIFASWMRILQQVPGSILWLAMTHTETPRYLVKEAKKLHINPERIIFAPMLPNAEHIKRYQVADLFLDTLWHNAHTTAIDALWQGLPVITCMGDVPSSRLAASLLNALEMPELITDNLDDYEKLAIHYATNDVARLAMREKLKAKRYTAPLFNTELTVRHIERAYSMVWERYQAGLAPVAIDVPPIEINEKSRISH